MEPQKHVEKPKLHVVSTVQYYRKLARTLVCPIDKVLEIGSSFGQTTEILARRAESVFAIDHSEQMVGETVQRCSQFPNVSAAWHDARDVHGVCARFPKADLVFLDVGGDASTSRAIGLTGLYISAFSPRCFVLRSIGVAILSSMIYEIEFSTDGKHLPWFDLPDRVCLLEKFATQGPTSDRLYAVRALSRAANKNMLSKRIRNQLCEDKSATVRRMAKKYLDF